MSVQNLQFAGYLLNRNSSNFLYVEGSTAWLFDCSQFLSLLIEADKCSDCIPIYYQDSVMYIDPKTRQILLIMLPLYRLTTIHRMSLH